MMVTYGNTTIIKSIIVQTYLAIWADVEHNLVEHNFYESEKGKWIKDNAVSIEKKWTTHANGSRVVNVIALFSESKYSFYILKWG